MTEKELRKLKRRDFLQLLLTQGKDLAAVQTRLDEKVEELGQLEASNERLKTKLDEKDALIEKLKGRLDDKDAAISALQQEIEDIKESRRIELEKAGSIATAALSLNGIFEAAQKAADQYLYNVRLMKDESDSDHQMETFEQQAALAAGPDSQSEKSSQAAKSTSQPAHAPKASKSDPVKQGTTPKSKTRVTMRSAQRVGLLDILSRHGRR